MRTTTLYYLTRTLNNTKMKKLTFLVICTLLLLSTLSAQQPIDFDKVVVPEGSRARTFEDYLVQLSWMNNPANKTFDEEIKIATQEISIKKWKWTDDFDAIFNYNESHFIQDFIKQDDEVQPTTLFTVFPRFNFGARISLGTLINNPKEKKKAEYELKITELERDQEKLAIRAKTLERYQNYLLSNEILLTRKQAEEDSYQTYLLIKEKFRRGDAELDDHNSASTSYYNAKEKFISAKSDVKVAIIQLEEMIGIPFADALKYGPKEKSKSKK